MKKEITFEIKNNKIIEAKTLSELKQNVSFAYKIVNEDSHKLKRKAEYFLEFINNVVALEFISEIKNRQKNITDLQIEGHGSKVWWGGELPNGCKICLEDKNRFMIIRSVAQCNLRCKHCYYYGDFDNNPVLDNDQFKLSNNIWNSSDIKNMIDRQGKKYNGLTWVYYEPFINIEKHYELADYIHKAGIYQWIYTNGTLCNEENLKELSETGLEEIRFDLAATLCSKQVINNMKIARKYFKYVGIEAPMYKEYFDSFIKNKDEILNIGIDFINCAEMHLDYNNIINFPNEDFYAYKNGYVSPKNSRRYTYNLLEIAQNENWKKITINDCSNELKVYRGIEQNDPFGIVNYEKDTVFSEEWYLNLIDNNKDIFLSYI